MKFAHACKIPTLLLSVVLLWPGFCENSFAAANHTKVKLLIGQSEAKPGDKIAAAVEFTMDPSWHIYWRNPGIGIAPTVEWELPEGITASGFQWPVPEKLLVAAQLAYVYESLVVLPFTLQIAPNAKAGKVGLKGSAGWLECDPKVCLPPAKDSVQGTLTIGTASTQAPEAALITEWLQKVPKPEAGLNPKATWAEQIKPDDRAIILEWAPKSAPKNPDFFPFENDDYNIDLKNEVLQADAKLVRVKRVLTKLGDKWPTQFAGLVFDNTEGGEKKAYEANFVIGGATTAMTETKSAASQIGRSHV